jgi:phosphohistidine swiveling domain-containing protein
VSDFIISLQKIKESDLLQVGCKAFSLARMKQIGLTVSPGFCVKTVASREHIEANELAGKIELALNKLKSTSSEERKSILLEIQQAIINAPFQGKLHNEIENHYHTLAADRVAVRSSATAEDLLGYSFAGQYETYLGIADLDGCIDAVKKCWASLWTERAYEYRQKNNFDHLAANMAVIVQALVEADASGVIFTADPVNGYKSRIVVEAVSGLGDALVSGKVTPDRFTIRKRNLNILSRRIQNGKIEFVFDKIGLIENTDENSYMRGPCIDNRIVKKLAKLARKTEIKFGCPQDIEWAIRGNKIFFLQSRPITAVPQKKSWDERQAWTNANTGEVFPDAITPITWSVMELMFNPLFESTVRLFGADLGNHKLAGLVASRVYFNINTAAGVVQHLPAMWGLKLNDSFGGEQGKMCELGKLDIPDEDIPDLGSSYAKMIIRLPYSVCDIFSHSQKKGMRILKKLSSSSRKLRDLDVSAMTDEQLTRQFEMAIEDTLKSCDLLCVLIGILAFPILSWICGKWLNDENGTIANRLLGGLNGMDDVQAGFELWNLSVKARESSQVETAILSNGNWQVIRGKIAAVEEGEKFLKKWDEFMAQHGHHCRGEMEVFNPRWSETPDYILSTIRNYLGDFGQSDPIQNYRDHIRKREQLTNRCRQQLKNPVKRLVFNHIVHRAQQGVIFRENWKSEAVRYTAALRSILLELGQRLNNKGIFENTNDIFFLKLEEIVPVTRSKPNLDVKETITSRRAEYEKNKSITPPMVVIGKFDPDNYTPDVVNTKVEVLNGLAVSPGVVTGKARVILKADTDEQVLPGEILVAPFTDPGWIPYFIPAAAIVMDVGGMLSHGSIIAREYGIPAVVNVGPATKVIKTGQTIQVDANKGVVKILR